MKSIEQLRVSSPIFAPALAYAFQSACATASFSRTSPRCQSSGFRLKDSVLAILSTRYQNSMEFD